MVATLRGSRRNGQNISFSEVWPFIQDHSRVRKSGRQVVSSVTLTLVEFVVYFHLSRVFCLQACLLSILVHFDIDRTFLGQSQPGNAQQTWSRIQWKARWKLDIWCGLFQIGWANANWNAEVYVWLFQQKKQQEKSTVLDLDTCRRVGYQFDRSEQSCYFWRLLEPCIRLAEHFQNLSVLLNHIFYIANYNFWEFIEQFSSFKIESRIVSLFRNTKRTLSMELSFSDLGKQSLVSFIAYSVLEPWKRRFTTDK